MWLLSIKLRIKFQLARSYKIPIYEWERTRWKKNVLYFNPNFCCKKKQKITLEQVYFDVHILTFLSSAKLWVCLRSESIRLLSILSKNFADQELSNHLRKGIHKSGILWRTSGNQPKFIRLLSICWRYFISFKLFE